MHIGLEECTTGYNALNFVVKSRCGLFYIAPSTSQYIVSIVEGPVEKLIVKKF